MALVANGVEVSLIAQRMGGSEQPTHQPAAAPAHTRTHTCIHTHHSQVCCTWAPVGVWCSTHQVGGGKKKIEMTKLNPERNRMRSIALAEDTATTPTTLARSLTRIDTLAHLTFSILLSPTHWHKLTRSYMPIEYSQMDYYQSRDYVTKDCFKLQTFNWNGERAQWDFVPYQRTFASFFTTLAMFDKWPAQWILNGEVVLIGLSQIIGLLLCQNPADLDIVCCWEFHSQPSSMWDRPTGGVTAVFPCQ